MGLKRLNQSIPSDNTSLEGSFLEEKSKFSTSYRVQAISNNLHTVGRKNEFNKAYIRGSNNYLIVHFCFLHEQDTSFLLRVLAPVYNFQYLSQEDEKRKKKIEPEVHESCNPTWLHSPGEPTQTNTEVLLTSHTNKASESAHLSSHCSSLWFT